MSAYYCPTAKEAVSKVVELIPDGSSVTWGGSMTLRDMGIPAALHARNSLDVMDRDLAASRDEAQEIYRKAFTADYYLSSANAISEDGVIVNIDGTGNRVTMAAYGPEKVYYICRLNQLSPDLPSAINRARNVAAPRNARRLGLETPCVKDGVCHNCQSPQRICNVMDITLRRPGAVEVGVWIIQEELA